VTFREALYVALMVLLALFALLVLAIALVLGSAYGAY
jgi:hypothetical protein